VYNTLTAPAATSIQGGIVIAIELKADINSHLAATYPAAGASLLALTASTIAAQVYDASELIAGGVTQVNRYPSLITFTTDAAGTPADAPATATITGTNLDTGLADTDIVNISQIAGTATATKIFILDDDFLITYSAGDGTDAQISIVGSDFVSTTAAVIGGQGLSTSYVSPTQLLATVPASYLGVSGTTLAIGAYTPGPGGGFSATTASLLVGAPHPRPEGPRGPRPAV
jgi:hypothetical protein